MKKLFGEINLTWKKVIIFAIVTAVYTAVMAILPITRDTSFRDIAAYFEWWILFGIIIICNSKSPLDSALKCFVFFLISQPLIYLFQVPFSSMGWKLFGYYKYWFIWTLLTIPMGYIGYYIKKDNIFSMIILLPMLIGLGVMGIGYINSAMESFPHHLLSGIVSFLFILIIVFGVLKNMKLRIAALIITAATLGTILFIHGLTDKKYETYHTLEKYNIELVGKLEIISFTGQKDGQASVVNNDPPYSVRIIGKKGEKYSFILADEEGHEYSFEYYFDENDKTVVLNLINSKEELAES